MKKLFFILHISSAIGLIATGVYVYTTYNNPLGTEITTMSQAQKAYFSNYWGVSVALMIFACSFSFFGHKFWNK